MATLREWPRYANGHATRMATLCERPWDERPLADSTSSSVRGTGFGQSQGHATRMATLCERPWDVADS
ncbi:hypothetical protein [Moorena producens]|uniref:hypothetical protein n=1 Tax=Moorena producens TaxID=1155739 RepID=UPI003C77776A